MYDIEDIDSRRTLERRRHNIFILPTCVASYNSQWDHVCYIGSAPRLAEDVAPQVPVPSRHPRESALGRSVIPRTSLRAPSEYPRDTQQCFAVSSSVKRERWES